MTTAERARRFAEEGWGTNPRWEDVWDELCDPGMVLHFCGTRDTAVGIRANKAFNAALFAGFPDIRQEIAGLVAEGDDAAYRHELSGTHTGPFLGMPATGRTTRITGMTWLRFRDGRIVEMIYELNHAELARQLRLAA